MERVPLVVEHNRSLPFTKDLFVGPRVRSRSPSTFMRFREFSSTRADARPSISRNLDASAVGVAKTSSWERLWTRSILRDRAERRRVRDEKNGSEEACEDGPAADAGSSKSNVRGFGAGASFMDYVSDSLQRTQIQTYDDEEPTMQPSILPLLRRLTGSSAIGCELQERMSGLSTV